MFVVKHTIPLQVWNIEVWKFGILMCGSLEYEGMEVLKLSISFHVASSCGHINRVVCVFYK